MRSMIPVTPQTIAFDQKPIKGCYSTTGRRCVYDHGLRSFLLATHIIGT